MLITFVLFILLLGFVLVFIGEYADVKVYSILGFILIFLISMLSLRVELYFGSGSMIEQLPNQIKNDDGAWIVYINKINEEITYKKWSDDVILGMQIQDIIATYLAIASIMGFVSVIARHKTQSIQRD